MRAIVIRIVIVAAIALAAWSSGYAQGTAMFDLTIDAPIGETTIRCVRGCQLFYLKDGRPSASHQFTFSCKGDDGAQRCSGQFGGGVVAQPVSK